jgi:hypothetical protein
MIAARQAKDVRVLTFLNEIETQAATLLPRESYRFHGHGPPAIFLFG